MSGESRIRAASAVITAAWEAGHGTAGELAAALDACCLLRSPQWVIERERLTEGGTTDAS